VVALAAPASARRVEAVADAGRGGLYVARYERAGEELRLVVDPHRVGAADWRPAGDSVAVSLDAVAGAEDVSRLAGRALATAAVRALRRPPLPRAGLEPVYLHGDGSAPRRPRV
jgi:hypothetical protein